MIIENMLAISEYIKTVFYFANNTALAAESQQTPIAVNTTAWKKNKDTNNEISFSSPRGTDILYYPIKNELVIKNSDYTINVKKETNSLDDTYFSSYDNFEHSTQKAYQFELFNNGEYVVKNVYLEVDDTSYLYIVYNTTIQKETEVLEIIASIED